MSQVVTIQKEASMEVTIYRVLCNSCGTELTFGDVEADRDGDITLSVDRCACQDKDIEEDGFEAGRQEERDNHTCEGLS